ncbi:MAG: UBP-type zinc finger domain-containing protein [Nocardioidaceae bacterium]|nr:UBP-type zinc finger domain-containing protein [Nocardioidaceae bacterium]
MGHVSPPLGSCCDSSPNRHATAHHRETSHPVVRSADPGETWRWCYVDEVLAT